MKKLLLGLSALAVVGVSTAASAETVVIRRDNGLHRGWEHGMHRGWEHRHRWDRREVTGTVCKTIVIHREGMTKRIRKCG